MPRPRRLAPYAYAVALAALPVLTAPALASAQLATFDDDASGCVAGSARDRSVSFGYEGFTWSNFNVVDGATAAGSNAAGQGYELGTVTGSCIAYNAFGRIASISATSGLPFTFNGGFFTGAFREGLQLHVEVCRAGVTVFTHDLALSQTRAQQLNVRWTGLDAVAFFPEVSTVSSSRTTCDSTTPPTRS